MNALKIETDPNKQATNPLGQKPKKATPTIGKPSMKEPAMMLGHKPQAIATKTPVDNEVSTKKPSIGQPGTGEMIDHSTGRQYSIAGDNMTVYDKKGKTLLSTNKGKIPTTKIAQRNPLGDKPGINPNVRNMSNSDFTTKLAMRGLKGNPLTQGQMASLAAERVIGGSKKSSVNTPSIAKMPELITKDSHPNMGWKERTRLNQAMIQAHASQANNVNTNTTARRNAALQSDDLAADRELDEQKLITNNRLTNSELALNEQKLSEAEQIAALKSKFVKARPGTRRSARLERELLTLQGKTIPKAQNWQEFELTVPADPEKKIRSHKKTMLFNPETRELATITPDGEFSLVPQPGTQGGDSEPNQETIDTQAQESQTNTGNAPQEALDHLEANRDTIDLFEQTFGYRPEGY